MDFKQIQEIIKSAKKSGLTELSIKDGEFSIHLKCESDVAPMMAAPQLVPQYVPQPMPQVAPQVPVASAPAAAPAPTAEDNGKYITVKSPMIGTFYRSEGPDKPAFVSVGDTIKTGQVLCIVEAMKLFNEIESEVSGKIVKVLAEDASPVEYDQPLFLVEPE